MLRLSRKTFEKRRRQKSRFLAAEKFTLLSIKLLQNTNFHERKVIEKMVFNGKIQ